MLGKSQHINKKKREKESTLIELISEIINKDEESKKPSKYVFQNTREAAKHNTKLLKKFKYELTSALKKERGSAMETGYEFRD